jgi:hypothetical protein
LPFDVSGIPSQQKIPQGKSNKRYILASTSFEHFTFIDKLVDWKMKKNILIGILSTINIGLICLLVVRIKTIDSDKGVLLIAFFYPVLIIFNLILALILRLLKNELYKSVLREVLILLLFLIPILIIVSSL